MKSPMLSKFVFAVALFGLMTSSAQAGLFKNLSFFNLFGSSNQSKYFKCPKEDQACLKGEEALYNDMQKRADDIEPRKGQIIRDYIANRIVSITQGNQYTNILLHPNLQSEKYKTAQDKFPICGFNVNWFMVKNSPYAPLIQAWRSSVNSETGYIRPMKLPNGFKCSLIARLDGVGTEIAELRCDRRLPVSTTQQTAIKMDFQRKEAIKFMDEHPLEFAPIPYTFETTTKAFAASACQKASAIGTLWAKNIQQNSSANTDCSQQRLFNEMNQF